MGQKLFLKGAIALSIFEKLLLTLKPNLLGKRKSIAILQSFLRVARVEPDIKIEILTLADMLYLILRLSHHSPRSQYIFCTFCLLIDVEGHFYISSPLITFALNKDNHLWLKCNRLLHGL